MNNFSTEISRFVDPHPVFHDPEDDQNDVTIAKLTDREKDAGEEVSGSKLRRKLAVLSTEEEKKYAGKKTSRSKLQRQQLINDFGKQIDEKKTDEREEEIDSEENVSSVGGDVLEESPDSDDSDEDDESVDEDEVADLMSFKSKMTKASLNRSHDSCDEEEEEDEEDEFEDDSEEDDNEIQENTGEDDNDNSSHDEMEEEEDDNEEDESEDNEDESDESEEDEGGISSFSNTDVHGEVQKGQAAKQQLGLWDSLLEGRIRFQKTISLVNQLPQPDTWTELVEEGEQSSQQQLINVQSQLKDLLDKLIQVQTLLSLQHNETEHIITGNKGPISSAVDEDDEEITSESEDEEKEDDVKKQKKEDKSTDDERGKKRKIALEDMPGFLAKRHAAFSVYRNDTIQKWYDKTKLSSGKVKSKSFGSFEMSTLKQIEQILSDKDRLIKRTQMRRSNYNVIGKNQEVPEAATTDTETANVETQSYDPEIFDDSDFYHQQLRELIERRTSNISDPIALSRQWLEIQKLRSKVKKKVDTKASKGRKVRYNIHKKLVNFMAPRETCTWSDAARDDLFKSLFGERPKFMTVDER